MKQNNKSYYKYSLYFAPTYLIVFLVVLLLLLFGHGNSLTVGAVVFGFWVFFPIPLFTIGIPSLLLLITILILILEKKEKMIKVLAIITSNALLSLVIWFCSLLFLFFASNLLVEIFHL